LKSDQLVCVCSHSTESHMVIKIAVDVNSDRVIHSFESHVLSFQYDY